MAKIRTCEKCVKASTDPLACIPNHLVHPEHHKPMVYSVHLEAICPHCGTLWRRGFDNRPVIIAVAS